MQLGRLYLLIFAFGFAVPAHAIRADLAASAAGLTRIGGSNAILKGVAGIVRAAEIDTEAKKLREQANEPAKAGADPQQKNELIQQATKLEEQRDAENAKAALELKQARESFVAADANDLATAAAKPSPTPAPTPKLVTTRVSYPGKPDESTFIGRPNRGSLVIVCQNGENCSTGAMPNAVVQGETFGGKTVKVNSLTDFQKALDQGAAYGDVWVIGHGSPGSVYLGGGDYLNATTARELAFPQRPVTLASCSVAGNCDLIETIASKTGNAVSANTRYMGVSTTGTYVRGGSEWVTVRPEIATPTITSPTTTTTVASTTTTTSPTFRASSSDQIFASIPKNPSSSTGSSSSSSSGGNNGIALLAMASAMKSQPAPAKAKTEEEKVAPIPGPQVQQISVADFVPPALPAADDIIDLSTIARAGLSTQKSTRGVKATPVKTTALATKP